LQFWRVAHSENKVDMMQQMLGMSDEEVARTFKAVDEAMEKKAISTLKPQL